MHPEVTPEPIIRTLTGIMAAQHLMVASEVGVFEELGEEALTTEELAARTGLPPRSVRILANALAGTGLLHKDDGRYRNSPETFTFLSGRTPADLRPYVRMAHKVGYPGWVGFEEAIRAGGATDSDVFEAGGDKQRILSEGIEALTGPAAAALASTVDFGPFHRLLDVGGGTGIHLRTVLERYPHLEGTLFELPTVAAQARDRLSELLQDGRASVVEGDLFEDPLPAGHDVVLVSHVLHLFTPQPNRDLLRRVRNCVEPGATLLLVDFWTNPDHTSPVPAVLAAGEFYRLTGGEVYSVEEARAWLADTGWKLRDHRPLQGPQSLIEAQAA